VESALPAPLTLALLPEASFPDLDLGGVRRERRFRKVVAAVAANPGVSLPRLFPDPSAYHVGPTPAGAAWIDVADRGADVYIRSTRKHSQVCSPKMTLNRLMSLRSSDSPSVITIVHDGILRPKD
jgi:hypothetical protein